MIQAADDVELILVSKDNNVSPKFQWGTFCAVASNSDRNYEYLIFQIVTVFKDFLSVITLLFLCSTNHLTEGSAHQKTASNKVTTEKVFVCTFIYLAEPLSKAMYMWGRHQKPAAVKEQT